jgi:RHS repeat-associated protein
MDAYDGLNTSTTLTPLDDYKERITYDADGNILTYKRNGNAANLAMDDLRYSYYYQAIDVSGNKSWKTYQPGQATNTAPADLYAYSNRLAHVKDAVATPNLTEDLESQPDNNYAYDEIGNLTKDAQEGITNIDWNVYGKIKGIVKTNGPVITYSYDASGNRVSKNVNSKETWYVRDATGNVMALYTKENSTAPLKLTESHLYGSSRLGVYNRDVNMDVNANNSVYVTGAKDNKGYRFIFERGFKFFELSNHLGNVLVTITDRTLQYRYAGSTALYYEADVSSASDYAPFGMQLIGRKYSSDKYRYGFNGKEKDVDINGLTAYDYGFRIYNPAIGKFLSVDPLINKYPMLSPYQFAANTPIIAVDIDGREPEIRIMFHSVSNGKSFFEITTHSDFLINDVETKARIKIQEQLKYISNKKGYWEIHKYPIVTKDGKTEYRDYGNATFVEAGINVQTGRIDLTLAQIDLSSKVTFVSQFTLSNPSVACARAAQKIIKDFGIKNGGSISSRIIIARENTDHSALVQTPQAKAGLDYINGQLDKQMPIMVGLNHTLGKTQSDGEAADHYVVIVGRNYDQTKKQYYFTFYEVGATEEEKGKSDKNRLYINSDNSITGTNYVGKKKFTVTDVRKN